jgi:hypothetical protein
LPPERTHGNRKEREEGAMGCTGSKVKGGAVSTGGTPDKFYAEFVEKLPKQDGKVVVVTGTTSGTGKSVLKKDLHHLMHACMH